MDLQAAEKATRGGAKAAIVAALLTFLVVTLAIMTDRPGRLEPWNDPWNYLDVVLLIILSFGVLRHSRAAAIILFVYYLAAQVMLAAEKGNPVGLVLAVIFLYYFGKAIWGAIVYHGIRKEMDPEYRPVRKAMYFLWVPVISISVIFASLTVISAFGPSLVVQSGAELKRSDLELLRAEGIVEQNEKIVLFFSNGLFSIREDGNILTDRRVISYEEVNGRIDVYEALYSEIESISIAEKGNSLSNTLLLVTLRDENSFYLLMSTENDGDSRFLEEAEKRIKR